MSGVTHCFTACTHSRPRSRTCYGARNDTAHLQDGSIASGISFTNCSSAQSGAQQAPGSTLTFENKWSASSAYYLLKLSTVSQCQRARTLRRHIAMLSCLGDLSC